jgi:hypothetical protein
VLHERALEVGAQSQARIRDLPITPEKLIA